MECPHCHRQINVGALLGSVSSQAKAEAARLNGAKGGLPKKKKRPQDANALAFKVAHYPQIRGA